MQIDERHATAPNSIAFIDAEKMSVYLKFWLSNGFFTLKPL